MQNCINPKGDIMKSNKATFQLKIDYIYYYGQNINSDPCIRNLRTIWKISRNGTLKHSDLSDVISLTTVIQIT